MRLSNFLVLLHSTPHLWLQAVGSDRKEEIADTSDRNEFPPWGGWVLALEIGWGAQRWFGHLITMPLGCFRLEVFWARPAGGRDISSGLGLGKRCWGQEYPTEPVVPTTRPDKHDGWFSNFTWTHCYIYYVEEHVYMLSQSNGSRMAWWWNKCNIF